MTQIQLTDEQVLEFKEKGWIYLPKVLSVEEIDKLKDDCKNSVVPGEPQAKSDLLSNERTRHIVSDSRIISFVKRLTGKPVVYYGESTFFYSKSVRRGWHTDDVHSYHRRHLLPDYDMVRVGIYLQDHKKNSGGVKIKTYSHKYFSPYQYMVSIARHLQDLLSGAAEPRPIPPIKMVKLWSESFLAPTEKGDVLMWDLKTLHSPWGVRLKFLPNWSFFPWLENLVPEFLCCPAPPNRSFVTITYGNPGEHFDEYIKYLSSRKDYVTHFSNSILGDKDAMKGVEEEFKDKGIQLRFDCLQHSKRVKEEMERS